MSGKRKTRKNAGEGYGYLFHGAFTEKKDAVAKEKKTKGAWVKGTPTKNGYRYIVMSPRLNPIKRKKRKNPDGSGGYFSEKIRAGSAEIVIWANTPAGPFHVQPYVNNGETATREAGKFKTLHTARKKAHAYIKKMGWDSRGNPSELLVMGANPHEDQGAGTREITLPAGSTLTIRMNPCEARPNPEPRPNWMGEFRAMQTRGTARRQDAAFRAEMKARERTHQAEEDRAEKFYSSLRRKAHKGARAARGVFHELYSRGNPAPVCGARIGGYTCSRKPGHRGPHLPQGATLRPKSRHPARFNPDAAAIREDFTGRPSDYVTIQEEPHMPGGDYAQLGELLALYVKPARGGQVMEIHFKNGQRPAIVTDESSRQLYFVGGHQDVTSSLEMFGAGAGEIVELGEARRIDYQQRKEHVPHPEDDRWRHQFGEDTGIMPAVCFDRRHKRLLLKGGEYQVRPEGIVN